MQADGCGWALISGILRVTGYRTTVGDKVETSTCEGVNYSLLLVLPLCRNSKGSFMGGFVTQNRVSPGFSPSDYSGEWFGSAGTSVRVAIDPFNGSGALTVPRQVTTSYRSGSEELAEDPWNIPESSIELRRQLREDYRKNGKSDPYDTGHTFSTSKQSFSLSTRSVTLPSTDGARVAYRGPLWLPTSNVYIVTGDQAPWHTVPEFTSGYYGTKAIDATRPLTPVANLATTLAELKREGFPQLKSSALNSNGGSPIRGIGSDYLNYEFGLKPLASELGNVAAATTNAKSILQQIERDAGRLVRRSYTFPDEVVATSKRGGDAVNITCPAQIPTTGWNALFWNSSPSGRHTQTDTTLRRIWFKGAYSYHWPKDRNKGFIDKLEGYERKLNALYGTRVTPAVLWDLAPWSWFGDWFGNIGDILDNASALSSDGLVLRYGYLMCETTHIRQVNISGIRLRSGAALPPVVQTYTTVRKQRVRASPYGFGSNPASFTTRQWAILAALGMTKTPNSLR